MMSVNHHEHNEACACGHHYRDQHDHSNIHIHAHDAAVIGSFSCRIPGDYEDAMEDLKCRLNHAAEDVRKAGGIERNCCPSVLA